MNRQASKKCDFAAKAAETAKKSKFIKRDRAENMVKRHKLELTRLSRHERQGVSHRLK
jgi:hypothetical protein